METVAPPRRRWFRREREERALTRANLPAMMLPSTVAGSNVSPRTALAIADCYACVRALADAAASLPLHVYRRGAGGRERVEGDVAELLRNPAPAITQSAFVSQLMAHLNLWGEAFIGRYRNGEGQVEQLAMISPERVHVELRGGMPMYSISDEAGRFVVVGEQDVIHVKGLSLDGLRGLSPIRQAREALGLAATLTEHSSRFFSNGARPTGVLKVPPGPAAEELIENLREGFEARHRGAANAGRIAVLSGEIGFEPISMPMADAEFMAQREYSTAEIARIFRVPPWMIGAKSGDSLTYSTVSEQSRAFVTYSLRPWLIAIEQSLTAALCPPASRSYVQFELDALLRADPATRAEIYTAALNGETGWMTRDEVRRLEDLPAEEAMTNA